MAHRTEYHHHARGLVICPGRAAELEGSGVLSSKRIHTRPTDYESRSIKSVEFGWGEVVNRLCMQWSFKTFEPGPFPFEDFQLMPSTTKSWILSYTTQKKNGDEDDTIPSQPHSLPSPHHPIYPYSFSQQFESPVAPCPSQPSRKAQLSQVPCVPAQ